MTCDPAAAQRAAGTVALDGQNSSVPCAGPLRHGSLRSRTVKPESQKPDFRPQLRELLKWYNEALGHIAAGAIVEPGEPERLRRSRV